jgi:hypothetical protein
MTTQTEVPSRRRGGRRLALGTAGLLILLLNACDEFDLTVESGSQVSTAPEAGQASQDPPPNERTRQSNGNIDPRMEPEPEAFQTKDFAVWNEAQTLPGIWIAHPEADVARRVRVTNDETGAQVDAAMFRRDPSLSGPRIILSSEIAKWLDITPGHATPVTIEALTYRTPAEPESASAAEPDDTDPAQVDAEPDPADDIGEPEKPLAEPSEEDAETESQDPADDATEQASGPIEAAPVEASAVEGPTTEPLTIEAEAEEAGQPAPAPPSAQEPQPESVSPENDDAALGEPARADVPDAEVDPASDPGTDPASDGANGLAADPVPPPAAPTAAEVPPADVSDITDGRIYIQAGIFGEAENAARLAEKLRAAGLVAVERPLTLGERKFTRVLVGPYDTIAGRDAALQTVREIGPADATPAKG